MLDIISWSEYAFWWHEYSDLQIILQEPEIKIKEVTQSQDMRDPTKLRNKGIVFL